MSACRSVFAAMNSIPSTLARIMRLTALHPPPPTPMTLIFAGDNSSLKLIRIAFSFDVIPIPLTGWVKLVIPTGPLLGPTGRPGCLRPGEHRPELGNKIRRALRLRAARLCTVQDQAHDSRVLGLLNLFRHVHQAARLPDTNGQVKGLLHHFDQAIEARAATGKNKAGRNLRVKTGAAHFVADQRQKFLGARLDDVGKHAREDRARRAITNACDFNRCVFLKKRGCSTTVMPLDPFGFGDGRAQADREIVCEVVATNGNRSGVADDAAAVNDKFCSAATDIEEAGTEIAFVLREASFGGSERFDNCVTDQDSSAIRGRYEILRGDH